MNFYGVQQLAADMRAVRENTIQHAAEIPESQFDFRPAPGSRSVAELLVHIAWLWTSDRILHQEARIDSFVGFDIPGLLAKSTVEEKRKRSKSEIIELLRTEGECEVQWLENRSDDFLAERVHLSDSMSVTRFELLLSTKEHEMQHRAQLTVMERMLGIIPKPTALW